MAVRHFHFGAGALGLGLVIPTFFGRVEFSVIANRASRAGNMRLGTISAQKSFRLDVFSAKGKKGNKSHTVPVEHAIDYETLAGHSTLNLDGVGAVVLTTALKRRGIEESIDALAGVSLAATSRSIPVMLLAAENQVDSRFVHELLTKKHPQLKEVYAVRCVVDRICNKPAIDAAGSQPAVLSLLAEEFAKIYLNKADVEDLPQLLRDVLDTNSQPVFEHVEDFEFVVNRKKWVVNSAHLLLGLYAHWSNYPTLHGFVESIPNIVDRLVDDVVKMSRIALRGETTSRKKVLPQDRKFAEALKGRLGRFPQFPHDVVTRFTGPDQLVDFFEDFHRKIAEPYLWTLTGMGSQTQVPMLPSYITMCVIDLIKTGRWINAPSETLLQ